MDWERPWAVLFGEKRKRRKRSHSRALAHEALPASPHRGWAASSALDKHMDQEPAIDREKFQFAHNNPLQTSAIVMGYGMSTCMMLCRRADSQKTPAEVNVTTQTWPPPCWWAVFVQTSARRHAHQQPKGLARTHCTTAVPRCEKLERDIAVRL